MKSFEKIYALVSFIPKGRVLTYKEIAKITKTGSAQIVGFALHKNQDPQKIPCHRVVGSSGFCAPGYVFGGPKKQKEKLEKEGIVFDSRGKLDLSQYLYRPSIVLRLYFNLLFQFQEYRALIV